jgi:hypothetical protein
MVLARELYSKHVSTVTNTHATIDEPWEEVFSVWSAPISSYSLHQKMEIEPVSKKLRLLKKLG